MSEVIYRAYQVRLYPTQEQATLLDKHFGCCRWIYNKMIEINEKKYKRAGKRLSAYDMRSYLPKLKKQHKWLAEVNADALQIVCHNLGAAYKGFFKKKTGYPNFKKKGMSGGFKCINGSKLMDKHIKLPKLGLIKYRGGTRPEGDARSFMISTMAGKYYASILIKSSESNPEVNAPIDILGIDLGLTSIITTSDGVTVEAPRYMKEYQRKLRKAKKTLSRRRKGSNRRKQALLNVATIYQRITNKRQDHNHKLTRIIIDKAENQSFAIENLNIKGMMANHKLAKSIADAGWYQFLKFLRYKAAAVGKPVLEVGRFFPSSKTCSVCGIVKESLALSERMWACDSCGAIHNRDINAAINIALEAARSAAHGGVVIPSVRKVYACEMQSVA